MSAHDVKPNRFSLDATTRTLEHKEQERGIVREYGRWVGAVLKSHFAMGHQISTHDEFIVCETCDAVYDTCP
jgi:hypothetical protein